MEKKRRVVLLQRDHVSKRSSSDLNTHEWSLYLRFRACSLYVLIQFAYLRMARSNAQLSDHTHCDTSEIQGARKISCMLFKTGIV